MSIRCFVEKRGAGRDFFLGGGGGGGNDDRQFFLGGGRGRVGARTPGHLGYVNQKISLPGETMHVTKLEGWFD